MAGLLNNHRLLEQMGVPPWEVKDNFREALESEPMVA